MIINKFCRYKGFKFLIEKEEQEGVFQVGTSDDTACGLFNMETFERGVYMMRIKEHDCECIWTEPNRITLVENVNVIKGELFVKPEEIQCIVNPMFNENIENGEFAFYSGQLFQSISGYNHFYIFRLMSYDFKSQYLGFIMEKPGVFFKNVLPNQIDFAYNSLTYCQYMNNTFVISYSRKSGNELLLEPYSADDFQNDFLVSLGFEMIDKYLKKWVNSKELTKIWTKREKIHDFERFIDSDKMLKQ